MSRKSSLLCVYNVRLFWSGARMNSVHQRNICNESTKPVLFTHDDNDTRKDFIPTSVWSCRRTGRHYRVQCGGGHGFFASWRMRTVFLGRPKGRLPQTNILDRYHVVSITLLGRQGFCQVQYYIQHLRSIRFGGIFPKFEIRKMTIDGPLVGGGWNLTVQEQPP